MATDQISFYDESLKKQIEGSSYRMAGQSMSVPYHTALRVPLTPILARASIIMHRFC